MGRMSFLILSFVCVLSLMATEFSSAQSKTEKKKSALPSIAFDCTSVSVNYMDDPLLTRDEKLALMNQALFTSLSKFDACQRSQTNAGGAASNNAGDSIGTGESGQQGASAASGGESLATSDMVGQEKPKTNEGEAGQSLNAAWSTPRGTTSGSASIGNGKLPEDIPPANNDSVLEAQIRQAAINETNHEIKAKLWNEYRKYKGLTTKN